MLRKHGPQTVIKGRPGKRERASIRDAIFLARKLDLSQNKSARLGKYR